MGQLNKSHLIEATVWSIIASIFFIYSYEFNQPIEIYKFGATAWPRSILLMLVLVIVGNLFYQRANGSNPQTGRVGITEDDLSDANKPISSFLNVGAFILLPLTFAWSLKPIGFYAASPIFIACIIFLLGERRANWIIGITIFIYAIIIGLFMIVLNAPLPQGTVSPFYDFSAFMLRLNTQIQNLF
jgi:hypothetical protein